MCSPYAWLNIFVQRAIRFPLLALLSLSLGSGCDDTIAMPTDIFIIASELIYSVYFAKFSTNLVDTILCNERTIECSQSVHDRSNGRRKKQKYTANDGNPGLTCGIIIWFERTRTYPVFCEIFDFCSVICFTWSVHEEWGIIDGLWFRTIHHSALFFLQEAEKSSVAHSSQRKIAIISCLCMEFPYIRRISLKSTWNQIIFGTTSLLESTKPSAH